VVWVAPDDGDVQPPRVRPREPFAAGQEVTVVWVAPDDGGERAVAARTVGETDEGARLASRRVG